MLAFNRPIGIEIQANLVRVAQLVERRGTVRVIRFAEQPLPAGYRWELGGDREPLVATIREALRAAGITGGRAIISLPRGQVTVRISAFPPADTAELKRVIEYDLADHIPFPVDQVVVDHQRLGNSREEPGLVDVMVVAAPRELVREHIKVIEELGLNVAGITVDALALDDIVGRKQREPIGLTVSLKLDERAALVNINEGDVLRLTRSLAFGLSQLRRAVQEDLEVTDAQAERLIESEGIALLDREPAPTRVRAWLDNLLGEIRRSALSLRPAGVTRLVLVGPLAAPSGLAEKLSRELDAEPVTIPAKEAFSEAELHGAAPLVADRCLGTMGAAFQATSRSKWRISLLLPEVVAARRQARTRWSIAALIVVAMSALAMLYLATSRNLHYQQARLTEIEKSTEQAETRKALAENILAEREHLRTQTEALEMVKIRRYASLELMRSIAFYAPEEIVLTYLSLRPEQSAEIRGRTPNSVYVADLQRALEQSPLITTVNLTNVERQQAQRGRAAEEAINFNMQLRLWNQRELEPRRISLRRPGESQ